MPPSPPTPCSPWPTPTCAGWAATSSPSSTTAPGRRRRWTRAGRAGSRRRPRSPAGRGPRGHAVPGRHPLGHRSRVRRRLVRLHERFGRLPLAEVLAPAIGYAEDGYPASLLLAFAAPMVADGARGGGLGHPPGARRPASAPASARPRPCGPSSGRAGTGSTAGPSARACWPSVAGEYEPDDLRPRAPLGRAPRPAGVGPRPLDDAAELAGLPDPGRGRGPRPA